MKIILIAIVAFSTSLSSLAMDRACLRGLATTTSNCIGVSPGQAGHYVEQVCPCCAADSCCSSSSCNDFMSLYHDHINEMINDIVIGVGYLFCCCCNDFFEEFRQQLREGEGNGIQAVLSARDEDEHFSE